MRATESSPFGGLLGHIGPAAELVPIPSLTDPMFGTGSQLSRIRDKVATPALPRAAAGAMG
jgi:hypothetical protein